MSGLGQSQILDGTPANRNTLLPGRWWSSAAFASGCSCPHFAKWANGEMSELEMISDTTRTNAKANMILGFPGTEAEVQIYHLGNIWLLGKSMTFLQLHQAEKIWNTEMGAHVVARHKIKCIPGNKNSLKQQLITKNIFPHTKPDLYCDEWWRCFCLKCTNGSVSN